MSNCPGCDGKCTCDPSKCEELPELPQSLKIGNLKRIDRTARIFAIAAKAHRGQFRKDLKTPYIRHPVRVAEYVIKYGGTEPQVFAAILHDVFEDCGDTYKVEIIECLYKMGYTKFSAFRVIQMVESLTKDNSLQNRAEKNQDAIDRCIYHGTEFLKLCDRLDNILDSDALSNKFAKRYFEETDHMLDEFKITGVLHDGTPGVYTALEDALSRVRSLRGIT